MTTDERHAVPEPPSPAVLARTTALALAVAGVVLVTTVLPAEYGIDPLGTGARLGLTAIASPPVVPVEPSRQAGAPLVPTPSGPVASYPGSYSYDVYEVELEPFESVEYKYQLEQHATMMFSWTATAPLVHDFHGQGVSAGAAAAPEESYDRQDRQGADGTFAAPFAGIHGWFWENPHADPVTVRLTTSGFYAGAIEFRAGRATARPVRGIETLAPAAGGSPAPVPVREE